MSAGSAVTYVDFRPNFPVKELARSIAFYRDLLGLELRVDAPDMGLAILGSGSAELALVLHTDPPKVSGYLSVVGVDALHAKVQAAGYALNSPLTQHPWGMKDFTVLDPDGHMVAVGERVAPIPSH